MPTVIDVYNMALDIASARTEMTELNEDTREGRVVRRWYQPVVDQVHKAAYWNFTRRVEALTVPTAQTTGPWAWRYDQPADMLAARFIEEQYAPFVISRQNILTNVENARLVFTQRIEQPNDWDPIFLMAVTFALAGAIAVPLMGDRALANDLYQKANQQIMQGRIVNGEEAISFVLVDQTPDWLMARDSATAYTNPYIVGLGPLFTELT